MMPGPLFQWHLAVLLISLGGFACLALGAEREGALLLHRAPGRRIRWVLRFFGWALLAWAFAVCAVKWRTNFGTVLWFGWLTVAGMSLVFAIAYWPWRRQPASPAARPRVVIERKTRLPRAARSALSLALIGIPLALGWSLARASGHPLP